MKCKYFDKRMDIHSARVVSDHFKNRTVSFSKSNCGRRTCGDDGYGWEYYWRWAWLVIYLEKLLCPCEERLLKCDCGIGPPRSVVSTHLTGRA
jgi:hypothetical protein